MYFMLYYKGYRYRIPLGDILAQMSIISTAAIPQAAATKEMDLSYVMETVDDNTPEPTTTDEGDDDDKVEGLDER